MVSPPRAVVVLALAGYDAGGMPGLQALLRGETAARVTDDHADGEADGEVDGEGLRAAPHTRHS
jgi:hypothetical protein